MPDGRRMERLKRRLDAVPGLLGGARSVRLCGLPAADDLDGALRVEGLLCLLAAHRMRATAGETEGREEAVIWLGGGGLAASSGLTALPRRAAVLLWPGPGGPEGCPDPGELASLAGPRWVLCRATPGPAGPTREILLPDPAHALWGLLDHHPRGAEGRVLDLAGGWPAEAAPTAERRWKAAARGVLAAALPPSRADRLRRRRRVEAARRRLAAHVAVATERIGPSVFAALLGRTVLAPGPEVLAYWRAWGATPTPFATPAELGCAA